MQNAAFVTRGRQGFSERHESSGTRADKTENNVVCHETAHDAPVNALTKIEAIRRAHGVRVNQRQCQSQNKTYDSKMVLHLLLGCLTVCVTGAGAGVDSAGKPRKLEARKILENAAESPASSARFVGRGMNARLADCSKPLPPYSCITMNDWK
jgi:hypothetical protein